MKKQGRRWIGAILAMLMLVVSFYTDASVTANAATKKASVSFANLPEGNTLKLEDTYKYDFNAKKTGTAKVVYFEVKNGTNTAGVQSSNSGIVYPVTAGKFDVRVVAFASTANRTKWLDARKKNGYVADPSAEKKYVVAASDWETITVTSETEGLGVARNQSALNKVLKNKKVTNVLIWTDAARTFEIGNKNYKSKTLTVNAPHSEITNSGRFAQINVEQIKPATFHEKAKGNKFHITAINARVIVEKGARILELIYKPLIKAADVATSGSFNFKLEIKGTVNTVNVAPQKEEGVTEVVTPVVEIETAENSNISEVKVEESTDLKLTGEKETAVKVTVEENAVNTKLTAEVPVKADLSANTTVTLAEDAKNSEITLSKKVDVEVKAADAEKAVEDVTINVAKEAEGASLKTEVKAEIKAEANATITLDKTAQDSTVTVTDENVKVEVEKTDEDGNVSKEEITSTPAPVPDTTTPSTPPTSEQPSTPTFSGTVNYTIGTETGTITAANDNKTVTLTTATGGAIKFSLSETDAKNFKVTADKETLSGSTTIIITVTTMTGGTEAKYTVTFTPANSGTTDPDDPNNPGTTDPDDPNNPGTTDPDDPNNPGTTDPDDSETETISVTLGGTITVVSGNAITVSSSAVTATGTVEVTNQTHSDNTVTVTITVTPSTGKTATVTFPTTFAGTIDGATATATVARADSKATTITEATTYSLTITVSANK